MLVFAANGEQYCPQQYTPSTGDDPPAHQEPGDRTAYPNRCASTKGVGDDKNIRWRDCASAVPRPRPWWEEQRRPLRWLRAFRVALRKTNLPARQRQRTLVIAAALATDYPEDDWADMRRGCLNVAALARESGMSERSVRDALDWLTANGWLFVKAPTVYVLINPLDFLAST